ncbi:hypothetical protein D3C80_1317460 [compost metagenome]
MHDTRQAGADHTAGGHQGDHRQRGGDDAGHAQVGVAVQGRNDHETTAHPQQAGQQPRQRTSQCQGPCAGERPTQTPLQWVEHARLDVAVRIVSFAAQLPGGLAPDAQAGVDQHAGEYQHQRCIGHAVRQHQAKGGDRDADQGNEQRRPVAHQALAQTQHGAHGGSQAHGQQADGRRLDHRQAKAKHQQWHRQNTAPGAGQCQHRTNDRAQARAQQLMFDHLPASATSGCGRASHSRPLSMPFQYKGGSTRAFSNQARRVGWRPSSNQRGKLGATLPP